MALIIRNGLLTTMTERGSIQSDVLVSNGRITRIAEHIDDGGLHHCIDAAGMTILPGLVDASVGDGGLDADYLTEVAVASGVTSALLRPDTGKICRILCSDGIQESVLRLCFPDQMTDAQLCSCLQEHAAAGLRDLCEIGSREQCQRVLRIAREIKARLVLANLTGCEGLTAEIAEGGFPVILGVRHSRCGSPWRMAAELDALGVPVAISCNHPAAKLKLLPVCAELCAREGMPRERALATITRTPAELLCLHDCGRIEEGCRADLAIFDGNPLLLATDLVMTIADGKMRRKTG